MSKIVCILLALVCLQAGMPFFALAQSNYSETLTITTYYPSPYGVYRNLEEERTGYLSFHLTLEDSLQGESSAHSLFVNVTRYFRDTFRTLQMLKDPRVFEIPTELNVWNE